MRYFYLEMLRGTVVGQRYLIPDGAVSIGRSSQNTIALPPAEKAVSGHHAVLYKSPDRLLLHDFQSTNGTYVNEQRIEEKVLEEGDVLGFGQGGPRLKLVVSDHELEALPVSNSTPLPGVQTGIKTQEERVPVIKPEETSMGDYEPAPGGSLFEDDDVDPSQTSELERKLVEKEFCSKDMRNLMRNEERIDKIASRGRVGQTQVNMLRSTVKAHNAERKQWYYVIAVLLFLSIAFSSYFAIRAHQYKNIVSKARTIKKDLNEYEERIAKAKNNPEKNKEEIKALIAEMEEKEKSLASLKTKMTEDDFGKFYSDPLEQRIDEVLMRFGETDYHIPPEMIERVRHHINHYSGRMHKTVARYIKRREKYFPMIRRIFRDKNLPLDLAYVSMLESGFNPKALSHAGARGLWQFMPRTGRHYGLKVTKTVDERCDPEMATYAAAEYFKDLIGIFGGKSAVMLCMAAYNAGEGRVMGALRKIDDPMRNRDFWYIYRMGYLAEETNEYIPRVIAFIIMSEHPEDYGFADNKAAIVDEYGEDVEPEADFDDFDYRIE